VAKNSLPQIRSDIVLRSIVRNFLALLICLLLLTAFATIAWTAWVGKCATYDEPLHFMGAWVQTHYDDFRCNPEDPPLWKFYVAAGTRKDALKMDWKSDQWSAMLSAIPLPSLIYATRTMYDMPENRDSEHLLRAGRARMLAVAVALGAVIAWWAWRLAGRLAAIAAAAAFCFDPNFLAHGPLVKNDVAITLVFVLVMLVVWFIGKRATIPRLIALALLAGAAVTVKFSGLLVFPMIAVALAIRALMGQPWPILKWTLNSRLGRCGAACAVVIGCLIASYGSIWACYGFRFGPTPDRGERFDYYRLTVYVAGSQMISRQDPPPLYPTNDQLEKWVNQWRPDATYRAVLFADKHELLPEAWLYGFLYTYGSAMARHAFLCGELRSGGWWYYFPLAMAFKTPLATLAGIGLAGIYAIWMLRRGSWDAWNLCAAAVGPVLYMAVAMHSHLNIGLRHIFPVYPFLFILLGAAFSRAFSRRPKLAAGIAGVLLVGLLIETLAAYPDYIPFFNVAAGGSRGGVRLLTDSNLDWGQDLPALAQWQREHPDRQIYFCQFGSVDPHYYGIHYVPLNGGMEPAPWPNPEKRNGLPPVYAMSAVALQGTYMPRNSRLMYQRFDHEQPIAVLHGTTYIFDK
jgi:hypothetical protein